MKKVYIIILISLMIITMNKIVLANDEITNLLQEQEETEEFKRWTELTDEEKEKYIMPRMYDVKYTETSKENLFYKSRLLKASFSSRYSLKDIIPNNLVIKNQQQTNSCWTFAALSSLETNLALKNYKNGTNLSKVYDFSERHMEYATSRIFANNVENKNGYNRKVGSGGGFIYAYSYLTNGSGAIPEEQMPFENNENIIDISKIQNKTVSSQVYDMALFPNYNTAGADKTKIIEQIKQHIQNYGSVQADLHGANSGVGGSSCYNNDTGAKYCNNSITHKADHGVSIIGWDDNYSIENFNQNSRPKENGAWIVRNSWGTRQEYKLTDIKIQIFNLYKEECIQQGWKTADAIPNSFIEKQGYTIENDIAYKKIGDNGIIYVSYEDVNISMDMAGVEKATDSVDYDYLYQYDMYYPNISVNVNTSDSIFLGNTFEKKTQGTEYLTQISLYAPETYTCKVYVNPNGTSKAKSDLQQVSLKAGESETFNSGYHTLEFSKPIEIKANTFAVVVEIKGTNSKVAISGETKKENTAWSYVSVEKEKCFFSVQKTFEQNQWSDLGNMYTTSNGSISNMDSTIKAYTTSTLQDGSIKNIEITTPPTKTSYFEGDNFDKTGMVVKATYNRKENPTVILDSSNYSITNGTNLKLGQTSVTISYEGKSVNQTISVEKNEVTQLKITVPPTKVEYKEGQSFDKNGMKVVATYKNGTSKEITDYTIEDGNNLKLNQTEIIISYDGKTVKQVITVAPNPLMEIKITKEPNKITYVIGQDFDRTGMVITGTYQDGSTYEIIDYTIENGTKLTKEQKYVTIKYQEKTVTQSITVEEKTITSIQISKMPSKVQYIQDREELDLTGGTINVNYNDNTSEEVDMKNEMITVTGFDNKTLGKKTITLMYQEKTVTFDVEIIEEVKPKNSNFDNITLNVNNVRFYAFTDKNIKGYMTVNVTLSNIDRNLENDSNEYYYYLSPNQNETAINDWVKITQNQSEKDKLQFEINTNDIPNFSDYVYSDTIYLYVKEVAIKGGNQSIEISKALNLDDNSVEDIELYLDNKKVELSSLNQGKGDSTTSPNILPKAGFKSFVIGVSIILVLFGLITFIRYKKLSKYIK